MTFRPSPLLLTGISCALAALIGVFVIRPALREIKTLNERFRMHRNALEILYQQGQNMRTSLEEYERIQPDLPLVNSSVLTLGEELAFITALEDIAARNRVTQTIRLDTAQPSPLAGQAQLAFRRVLLRLDVQGTYDQLFRVWRDLEAMPAYLNIIQLSLASNSKFVPYYPAVGGNAAPGMPLTGTFTAATYWRAPQK